jgi:hypothetical protein
MSSSLLTLSSFRNRALIVWWSILKHFAGGNPGPGLEAEERRKWDVAASAEFLGRDVRQP